MSTLLSKILPRTFTRQIIFLIAVLGVIAALANLTVSGYYEYKFLKRNTDAAITNQFQAVSRIFSEAVIYNNIYDLYTRAEAMAQFLDFVDNIYIFDSNGDYLTDARVERDVANIADIQSAATMVFTLDAGVERVGYVVYIENSTYIPSILFTHLSGLGVFGILLLAAGIFIGTLISNFLTEPLNRLSNELKEQTALPLALTTPAYAPKEVKILKDSLNKLSRTVTEQEKNIIRGEKLAAIGTMAAGLAHQLKNPIMTIELLTHCISENRSTGEDIKVIRNESAHITKILNEFLTLSKPLNLTYTEFESTVFMAAIESFVKSRFQGRITLKFVTPDSFLMVADMQKLTDVLANLITNSYEAGADMVSVEIFKEQHNIMIKVVDNGRGIPLELKNNIFRPFYTSKESGTGLGLAYSEMILEAMDATIELTTSDTGAAFMIKLPAVRI